ncbi:MAG: 50S ribosome-binding GTPase [Candidatus Brocadiae bacterium]|nr:50S ribosome-binding GTPase [Candidatus Brocadiia bacterium]
MKKYPLKIVIAGHVDHGKSTFIGRLLLATQSLAPEKLAEIQKISKELGKDTEIAYISDQLKEERENNLTIDTTQTFFKTKKRKYTIIDAPGHLEFIKNMISGATLAQTGVLIVDAKEGIQDQTRRHSYLFQILGLKKWIVAVNKMDAVDYSESCFLNLQKNLLEFFQKIPAEPYAVIPISARAGENISRKSDFMKWYTGKPLLDVLDSLDMEDKKIKESLRLPVQDVYEKQGEKMPVGRISCGSIHKGQKVIILPEVQEATVKSIEIFLKKTKIAKESENIGILFQEMLSAKRGQIITQRENPPKPTQSFEARLFWLSDEPLFVGKPFSLRCATQEVQATIDKIIEKRDSSTLDLIEKDAASLAKNETAIARFHTNEPVLVEKFSEIPELGRFVIEEKSSILGTGIVQE